MYRDGTGVPPWKEISGGFAPSQPTGEGAVSAGYSKVWIKFFKLDQSRQGFSSKCATRNWGKGHGVPHRHLWSSSWQSPKLHEPLQQVEGVSWITLNNRKLLSTMCCQKKVMIYSFCPQCLGKGVTDLEDNREKRPGARVVVSDAADAVPR